MKKQISLTALIVIILMLPFSSHAEHQKMHKERITFSVEGIYEALQDSYRSKASCGHHDFRKMAEDIYGYLKDRGKGHTRTPFYCDGREVQFRNVGNSNFMQLTIRDKID
ncbi:hypothetical protein ACFL9T_11285 [Thermodesulfobacteriota bacterium]